MANEGLRAGTGGNPRPAARSALPAAALSRTRRPPPAPRRWGRDRPGQGYAPRVASWRIRSVSNTRYGVPSGRKMSWCQMIGSSDAYG